MAARKNLEIVMRDPSELIPAEYNPRKLSKKQRDDITASLNRFGFAEPVCVNKHEDRMNIIIGGHQRTSVAKDIGLKEVPTVELNLTYEMERELNVRLNKNSGEWDFEELQAHFQNDELIEWGFDSEELDFFEPEEVEMPDLGDGSDSPIKVMSFTFSVDQSELVEDAINKAKGELDCIDSVNENTNGNALHAILRAWLNE